ncbi:LysR family transcriptional regulator [Consotaella aegiceratis]|uniref:LysR family transcriptional regulator n=1 Tax=Consotaella aegiceratis TaxID=3097961 RepID=UPI002F427CF0
MDWDDLRHFAAFVTAGSLSGAARELRIEHATVARRIAALEATLGLKLIDRRGRRLILTSEGERVAALAERMGEEVRTVERLAAGSRSDLEGEVTISAPSAYAAGFLAPRLARLRERHPGLSVRLLGEARTASLEHREADVAIRLSRPDRGDLTAVRIGAMSFRLYGDVAYLAKTRRADWFFIGNEGPMASSPQQAALERFAGRERFGFRADHVEIQVSLARAGAGIAMLPDFLIGEGAPLVPACPDVPPLLREVWLVFHTDMKASAPVRAVTECLRAEGTEGMLD